MTFSCTIGIFPYICTKEQALIQEYYDSPKAELVAIYGRRRVGKTYLIKSFFNQQFDFYFTGAFEPPKATLLRLFQTQLERYSGKKRKKPQDWFSGNIFIKILHIEDIG